MTKCKGEVGAIHSFESFATLDGDGIRYAVFLSGCPLRCVYCHNPDTWCAPARYEFTPEQLVAKIKRYRPYFGDRGGVTFSGGEPLLQAAFIARCAPLLAAEGIGYALDTSGQVDAGDADVRAAVGGADLILLDLKFYTEEDYRRYTGGSLKRTLDFLDLAQRLGKRVQIRTVIVPQINDTEREVDRYLSIVKHATCIEKYELLAFHTMGFDKYRKAGIVNPLEGKQGLAAERLAALQRYADDARKAFGAKR